MENFFRKEVFENLHHKLEGDVYLILPPKYKFLLMFILAFVLVALTFLSLGNYKRKERVVGVVEPSMGVVKLHALQNGVVSKIMVSDGDFVEKGTPILRVASAMYSEGGEELNQSLHEKYSSQLAVLELQIRNQKETNIIEGEELKNKKNNIEVRISRLEETSFIFSERLALNKQLLDNIGSLQSTGYISKLDLQRQQDTLLHLKQQATSIKTERLLLISQLEQLDSRLKKLPYIQQQKLNQLYDRKNELSGKILSIKQRKVGEVRAPKAGTITNILVKPGMNVKVNQSLGTILPSNSNLRAVLYVPTSAYGFLQTGQEVKLRYHAFPYEKYGVQGGRILQLSDSLTLPSEVTTPGLFHKPAYRIEVQLESQSINAYGKPTPLKAGMLLDADIVVEERSLIRWLFDPIFSLQGRL